MYEDMLEHGDEPLGLDGLPDHDHDDAPAGADRQGPGDAPMDVDPVPVNENQARGNAIVHFDPIDLEIDQVGPPRCGAGFPKAYSDFTDLTGQFPKYRRRNDQRMILFVRGQRVDEYDYRWVVPYNPYLLQLFD